MPSLELRTNVKLSNPEAFLKEFSEFSAETLGKPIKYICVSYQYNEHLAFHGTFDPAFLLNIVTLDNVNPTSNEEYSKKFFAFFKEKLGLPDDRGYILILDPGRENLAHQSTLFTTIFGKL